MGLLTQALAGGIGAAANTGAAMLMKNYEAGIQSERDKAQAVREENLARLRQSLSDASMEKSNGLALSSAYDPDSGRQLTNNEANSYDKDTLVGAETAKQNFAINPTYTIDGRPATNQQIMDNADANENIQNVKDDAKERASSAISQILQNPNIPDAEKQKILASGEFTDEDNSIVDSWRGDAGQLYNTKEAMLESKLAAQKEASDLKYSTLEKNAQLRADTALQVANLNYQHAVDVANIRANRGNASATKEAAAAVKLAEEQRKSANAAVSMLKDADMSDPSNVRLFNRHMIAAGEPEGMKPIPEGKEAPKKDDTGVFAKLKTMAGYGDDPAPKKAGLINTPAKAPQLADGSQGAYNFSALPRGSQPVPGKFTKNGRPVFKAPNGQLVAPKLTR